MTAKDTGPVAITNERKGQHGDWNEQSLCNDSLDKVAHESANYHSLLPYQRKAVDMILVKLSRILSGNPKHEDHWDDISGYAYLGKGGHNPKKDTK